MLKKILLMMIYIILGVGTTFSINMEEELEYLKGLNIEIDKEVLNKQQLSRYEVVKYLNYAKCFDCIYPPLNIKKQFNLNWFQRFQKQDRFYLNDITLKDIYYYCVVNLANVDYIHGYPKSNPICGGDFCGKNNMYFGELLQVVLNIISENIALHYYIDNVDTFYSNMLSIKGTKEQTRVNIIDSDYILAEKIKNLGKEKYNIKSFQELFLYQKYCNIFPKECNFKEFGKIKKGDYMLSLINILYKEDLLELKDAKNINPAKAVSGKDLVDWLYKIKKISKCKIDNDYDKDSIKNWNDNCMYHYNPNQIDTDGDGIGDVCDPDIDNDTICNPIGIVDELGNIIANKVKKTGCNECEGQTGQCDNCLFKVNTDQKDVNNNGIGDACEKKGYDLIGIKIVCNPLQGYAPLHTKCIAKTTGPVVKIVRTYKGSVIGEGWGIPHTFFTKGYKTITATAIGENNDTAVASAYFKVAERGYPIWYEVGLQIKGNPTYAPEGTKVTFTKEIRGDLDKIRWYFGDGSIYTKKPSVNPIKLYPKKGYYKVLAEGIKNDRVVARSYEYIKIYKRYRKLPTSYLRSNPLEGYVHQDIKFKLITKNVKIENVDKVDWYFGDNKTKTTQTLDTTHPYENAGAYPVEAIIFLKDGTKLDNFITQKIIDRKKFINYGASMIGVPLRQLIGKRVDFTIIPKGFDIDDVKKINWLYGDGTQFINHSFKSNHKYYSMGKKYVIANITLNNDEVVTTSLTEVIIGKYVCGDATARQKAFHCDMDKDGIPDMCDDDIDGDGIKNLMQLILFEHKDCSITCDNTDSERMQEETEIAKKGGDKDNCPFKVNANQKDEDHNGVGNVCDTGCLDKTNHCILDSDGDGVDDCSDNCPEIPENINGIEDGDGCPEIPDTPDQPIFQVQNCNTCPCHFADYSSPFMPGTIIKALLVDPANPNRFYNVSQGVRY